MRSQGNHDQANDRPAKTPLRVCFVFASTGLGGAERSMIRLMRYAHPAALFCRVIICRTGSSHLKDEVRKMGIWVEQFGTFAFTELCNAFREFQPDVVYLFGEMRTILWVLAARRAGIRTCIGAERGSGERWINRWGRRFDRQLLQGYVTNSRRTASIMVRRMGISENRIAVVYNGLEETSNEPCPPAPNLQWGYPSILCAANLLPNKGQIVLMRAIRLLRKEYPSIRAVLVGEDHWEGRLMEQAHQEHLEDTFTWAGFCPDVRGFLRHADIFVLPTLFREGMPTALLEAMLEGLPVIGTKVGAVTELIDHGRNGLVVEPNKPDQLAEALRNLLRSPGWSKQLGRAARKFVLQHFSISQMVNGHVNAFRRFMDRTLPAGPKGHFENSQF